MAEQPLWFFTKSTVRCFLGISSIVISAIWGVLSGVFMPLAISTLIGQLGTAPATQTARWLAGLFVAIGFLEGLQRYICDKARRELRARGDNSIGVELRCRPLTDGEVGTPEMTIARFLSAQGHAIEIVAGEAVQLVVGLGGFVIVLARHGVPWWVYIVLAVLIAVAGAAYWPLQNTADSKKAAELESQEIDCLANIRKARLWEWEQAQPALHRAQKAATKAALWARRVADRRKFGYVSSRIGINTTLRAVAVLAAVSVNLETATLLIVFVFTFGGHLSTIHYMVEFVQKINVDGEGLLRIIREPLKPGLRVDPARPCLQAKNLQVIYPGTEGQPDTVIRINSVAAGQGQTVVLTGGNGSGKSTFLNAIHGSVPYSGGSLKLWGQEKRDHEASQATASFSQIRIPVPVKAGDLFVDDDGRVNKKVMRLVLSYVNMPDGFDLRKRHDKLSGGERQKLDLALLFYRALVRKPGLITIDEPTNNLDPESVQRLRTIGFPLFLNEYEGTALVAPHDVGLQRVLDRGGACRVRAL